MNRPKPLTLSSTAVNPEPREQSVVLSTKGRTLDRRPRVFAKPDSVVRTTPREGDIVLARDSRSDRFTLRRHPETAQLRTSSRQDAVRVAHSFAHRHAVDVWDSENGAYRLLEARRPMTAAGAFAGEGENCDPRAE